MEILIAACGGALVSGIFMLLSQWIQRRAAKNDKEDDRTASIVEALQFIMLDRIKWLGQSYIRDGVVDFDDRRLLNQMHQVYHNKLGGNGDLDLVISEVGKLPLKQ